ncbi:hypothetical protein ACCO45_000208 [Purpureocillium lilacinum]|uniref:Uncharacterized protein n=1 Tax=Purpureocillium lilacinum TaxID=33203 RepID=A0ACC4E4Z3_PURLI
MLASTLGAYARGVSTGVASSCDRLGRPHFLPWPCVCHHAYEFPAPASIRTTLSLATCDRRPPPPPTTPTRQRPARTCDHGHALVADNVTPLDTPSAAARARRRLSSPGGSVRIPRADEDRGHDHRLSLPFATRRRPARFEQQPRCASEPFLRDDVSPADDCRLDAACLLHRPAHPARDGARRLDLVTPRLILLSACATSPINKPTPSAPKDAARPVAMTL